MSVETMSAPSVSTPGISAGIETMNLGAAPSLEFSPGGTAFSQPVSITPEASLLTTPQITEFEKPQTLDFQVIQNPFIATFEPNVSASELHKFESVSINRSDLNHGLEPTSHESISVNDLLGEKSISQSISELAQSDTTEVVAEVEKPLFTSETINPAIRETVNKALLATAQDIITRTEQMVGEETYNPEQAVGNFITSVITLDSQEKEADKQALTAQIERVEASTFTGQEKAMWTQKLKNAVEQKIQKEEPVEKGIMIEPQNAVHLQTAMEIDAQTVTQTENDTTAKLQTETQAATQMQISSETSIETSTQTEAAADEAAETKAQLQSGEQIDSQKPAPPKTAIGQEAEEPQEEKGAKKKIWDVYSVRQGWKLAKTSLKRRLEEASRIVTDAFQFSQEPTDKMGMPFYKLDVPSVDEAVQMADGDLRRPTVAAEAHAAAAFSDGESERIVWQNVQKAVASKPPEKIHLEPKFESSVEEDMLEAPAKALAKKGAQAIINRDGQYKAVKTLPLRHPREMKKEEKAA